MFQVVAIPAIEIVTPVPDASVTFQESLTVVFPPIVTADGDALKLFIVGAGHAETVIVVCAVDCPPHPALAVSV